MPQLTSTPHITLIVPLSITNKHFSTPLNSQIITLLSNESIKRVSISIIISLSIILEPVNSFTFSNVWLSIYIPSSVSDGMSKSNSIINHHYPIALSLFYRNWYHLLGIEIEKEDLINQSSLSFILFIINSFDSVVNISPYIALNLRIMDWSWVRSHSSVIQSSYSQILSSDSKRMHQHQIEWM